MKMTKNLVLRPILATKFAKRQALLQAIIVCNFKKSKRTKLDKMAKNRVSGLNVAPLEHTQVPNFFSWILAQLSLYAISKKTNRQRLRKWQKTSFRTDFGPFGPKLGAKFFLMKFTSNTCQTLLQANIFAISRKTNEPNLRKWQKTQFRDRFWALWPRFRLHFFFLNFISATCQALL